MGENYDTETLPLEYVGDKKSMKMSSLISEESRVVIDVGGRRFATNVSTLLNVPNTRLARLVDYRQRSVPRQPAEFFFDRNCFLFEYILDFYRTGELHLPQNRCGKALKTELNFWGLTEADIASCCWKAFTDSTDQVSTQEKIEKEFDALCEKRCLSKLDDSLKSKIWAFLVYPKSSTAAKVS